MEPQLKELSSYWISYRHDMLAFEGLRGAALRNGKFQPSGKNLGTMQMQRTSPE
jgi:hypothetical protein